MVLLYLKPDIPGLSMYTVVWLIWRSFCQYYLVDYRKCFKMRSVRLVNLVFVMFFVLTRILHMETFQREKWKIIINHIQQQAHSGDTVVYITHHHAEWAEFSTFALTSLGWNIHHPVRYSRWFIYCWEFSMYQSLQHDSTWFWMMALK